MSSLPPLPFAAPRPRSFEPVSRRRRALLPLALVALAPGAAGQTPSVGPSSSARGLAPRTRTITLERLFGTGDPMPGYADTFNALGARTSLDDGQVAFQAFGGQTQTTVLYLAPASGGGGALPIVDSTTTMPNSSVPFRGMSVPIVHAGECVFSAKYVTADPWGIYRGSGGAIDVVIDRTSGYQGFVVEGFDGEDVAFRAAETFGALWVQHRLGGPLRYVATSADPLPGVADAVILEVRDVFLDDGWLVFSARCQDSVTFETFYAIVRYDVGSGGLETLVGRATEVPGAEGTFTYLSDPTIEGDRVLFLGSQGNPGFGGLAGLYSWSAGSLSVVVDTNTERPDGSGTFEGFQGTFVGWRTDGPDTVFSATDVVGEPVGIYLDGRAGIVPIVEVGDRLDGRTIEEIDFWHEGYDRGQLVFRGTFEDGARELWVASFD